MRKLIERLVKGLTAKQFLALVYSLVALVVALNIAVMVCSVLTIMVVWPLVSGFTAFVVGWVFVSFWGYCLTGILKTIVAGLKAKVSADYYLS